MTLSLFKRLKFKFYTWVLSWKFIDNHIRQVEMRAIERGKHQGKNTTLVTVADNLGLQWPEQPTVELYSTLKWLWLNSPRLVMFKFPICPLENEEGEHIGFVYDPSVNLNNIRWILTEVWLQENSK
jgi:hypothetical protein